MKRNLLTLFAFFMLLAAQAQTNGLLGFATYSAMGIDGVTGGGKGQVVHVSNRAEFEQYATAPQPYVIIVDNDIQGKGMAVKDVIAITSNKTIIGAGAGKALQGICIDMKDQQNVIFRNLYISKGNDDAIAMRNCHHIWIDHCDLSDSYDGLLDFTLASDYITVTWTKLHDHDKVSITNSGTCHFEDYGREHITFAHCWFANNVQRNPRIGYGRMHIYNCYWTNISSYCIGFHSQAQVLSENNYFTKTANHPFNNQYSNVLPYCGYLTDRGSYFANGDPGKTYSQKFKDISYTPLTYYNYAFDLLPTDRVEGSIQQTGPTDGIQHQPILSPGNGAIGIPTTQPLSWGNVDGATSYNLYIGTSPDELKLTAPADVRLAPATTYYWQVQAMGTPQTSASPVYQFTTAADVASDPYPADGATDPWLRWPAEAGRYCTDMPLTWRPAADVASYKIYMGTSAGALQCIGETSALTFTPAALSIGTTYFWRVDAIDHNGGEHQGNTWTFSTPAKEWVVGENEAEDGYLSGIAFKLKDATFSGNNCVRGDQGPGSITANFNGPAGTYALSTLYYNMTGGRTQMAVSVNGKPVDEWITSGADNNMAVRNTRRIVQLSPGDNIRIDFIAGYLNNKLDNEGYGKIDMLVIKKAEGETVDVIRKGGIYHAPMPTAGYDHEFITTEQFLFRDSLGTIGQYDDIQVKDEYCSWITKNSDSYTLYLRQAELAKMEYRHADGRIETVTQELKYDQTYEQQVLARHNGADLRALRLYKSLPKDTVLHQPVIVNDAEYELILSPDAVFTDSKGTKGVAGKIQIRDGYDLWMKYYNPTANEVQGAARHAYISPYNDGSYGRIITGADRSDMSYVVGVDKNMNYFIRDCSHIKLYYTGSGGAATYLMMEVMASDGTTQTLCGGDAIGKDLASSIVEADLNPALTYHIRALAPSDGGDICIYAVKLWPGTNDGIIPISNDDSLSDTKRYNLSGQRVGSAYKGIVIRKGRKSY